VQESLFETPPTVTVAVITTSPVDFGITVPSEVTVAIVSSELSYVTVASFTRSTALPLVYSAVSVSLSPSASSRIRNALS